MWSEVKEHRWSVSLFLAYWAVALVLDVAGWRKPAGRDDMVPLVLCLHVLLPVMAGAMTGGWRRSPRWRMKAVMIAGACVSVVDVLGVLGFAFAMHVGDSAGGGEPFIELPVLLLAIATFGALLGLLGAAVTTAAARLQGLER